MGFGHVSPVNGSFAVPGSCYVLVTLGVLAGGCNSRAPAAWWWTRPSPPAAALPATAPARPDHEDPPLASDNPLKLVAAPPAGAAGPIRVIRLDVVLTPLLVQIPRTERARAEPVWNHLREDLFDGDTALRLRRNGLRVGVGVAEWWDAVQSVLNSVAGVRSNSVAPLRVPANCPLALELDTGPREQTLFCVDHDGILKGETWPHSRNVLRVSYELNLRDPERVRLTVVPEVRQRLDGWRWVRTDTGLTQMPNYSGRAFGAAALAVDLQPGEFLLLAPSELADVYGLIGGSFLATEEEGRRYDSYVFLRADVNHVAQRH